MCASIIEQAEHSLLGIEFDVGMRPRNRWVGSGRVVSKCHVILPCKPLLRVGDFGEPSQIDAFLLHAKLLLLGSPGNNRKQDFSHFL